MPNAAEQGLEECNEKTCYKVTHNSKKNNPPFSAYNTAVLKPSSKQWTVTDLYIIVMKSGKLIVNAFHRLHQAQFIYWSSLKQEKLDAVKPETKIVKQLIGAYFTIGQGVKVHMAEQIVSDITLLLGAKAVKPKLKKTLTKVTLTVPHRGHTEAQSEAWCLLHLSHVQNTSSARSSSAEQPGNRPAITLQALPCPWMDMAPLFWIESRFYPVCASDEEVVEFAFFESCQRPYGVVNALRCSCSKQLQQQQQQKFIYRLKMLLISD
ncbi:hypothetical protein Anapl_09091 [Anas platyrhynchos]|uniref:Uncharacterized protein n=1 Tax=Anas platyrhynchos TaxID=8839 RepID=R0L2V2_ANAPL|nr:hypothetical protein Anapl_09091 [Anas platyrhynchos]